MRPIDSNQYISFIEENGTGLEKARFRQLFYGVQPEPDVVQPFLELQNDAGGFPCQMAQGNPNSANDILWRWVSEDGEAYTVVATIGALNALKQYGLLDI